VNDVVLPAAAVVTSGGGRAAQAGGLRCGWEAVKQTPHQSPLLPVGRRLHLSRRPRREAAAPHGVGQT